MKPTLDENGQLVPREDYRFATLNCGEEDFAVACMRSNLHYGKNQKREDVKSHHYIISFDPRDGTDNGLTVDKAQSLGEEFCREHFPGHQAIVCTHPDGHNHSGNIHVHIVINSLRIEAVPLLPYMDRPADTKSGMKHRCTDAAMELSLIHISYMAFFSSAIDTLQTLVIALGAGLGVWGVVNLLEGYGSDNPGSCLLYTSLCRLVAIHRRQFYVWA